MLGVVLHYTNGVVESTSISNLNIDYNNDIGAVDIMFIDPAGAPIKWMSDVEGADGIFIFGCHIFTSLDGLLNFLKISNGDSGGGIAPIK